MGSGEGLSLEGGVCCGGMGWDGMVGVWEHAYMNVECAAGPQRRCARAIVTSRLESKEISKADSKKCSWYKRIPT